MARRILWLFLLCSGQVLAGEDVGATLPAEISGASLLSNESVRIQAELRGGLGGKTLAGVIRFSPKALAMDNEATAALDEIAEKLKEDKRLDVVLVAYVDLSGSREYGVALSDKQVSAVETGLLQRGVKRSQIRRNISGYADMETCAASDCLHAASAVEMHLVN